VQRTVSSEMGTRPSELTRVSSVLVDNDDMYWPPPRDRLYHTAIELISLHNSPKLGECRPRFNGMRSECHKYAPELSGAPVSPDNLSSSSPAVKLSLFPTGGFCAVSSRLPLPQNVETDFTTPTIDQNGMNAKIVSEVHCVAAEPHATFLHIAVTQGRQQVAYASAVLGRLRRGYRIFQMRSNLGTRIELCYLFVRIRISSVHNLWATPRQLRIQNSYRNSELNELREEVAGMTTELEKMDDLKRHIAKLQSHTVEVATSGEAALEMAPHTSDEAPRPRVEAASFILSNQQNASAPASAPAVAAQLSSPQRVLPETAAASTGARLSIPFGRTRSKAKLPMGRQQPAEAKSPTPSLLRGRKSRAASDQEDDASLQPQPKLYAPSRETLDVDAMQNDKQGWV